MHLSNFCLFGLESAFHKRQGLGCGMCSGAGSWYSTPASTGVDLGPRMRGLKRPTELETTCKMIKMNSGSVFLYDIGLAFTFDCITLVCDRSNPHALWST